MRARTVLAVLTLAVGAAISMPARGDEFVDQANRVYATIKPDRRSDLVLLPLLAKLDATPGSVSTIDKAMLLPATSSAFKPASDWATGAPQKAALEGLRKIAQGDSLMEGFAFGQPYGDQAVAATNGGIDLIRAGLFTDLGDPPLLSAAKFRYLDALDQLAILAHVEATRLQSEGKPSEALTLLGDLVFLGRQMTEREFLIETRWGFHTMSLALQRLRDIAYQDWHSGKSLLKPEELAALSTRIRSDGYLRLDLIPFPKGDRIAADQAVAATFTKGGGANGSVFATTMARLGSTQQPLRLFAEAAKWESVAASHAKQADTSARVERIYGDWASRWPIGTFDPRNALTTDYEKTSRSEYAAVFATAPDASPLFNDRQIVQTQLVGTRCALGVVGFTLRAGNFPPDLEAIRPIYVKTLEADPFNPDRTTGRVPLLEYFVPIRDSGRAAGGGTGPHEMNVVYPGVANFQVKLGQDQFVLYSVGPNGRKDFARDVSNDPEKTAVGDLLLWPPVISLVRQRMIETGQLK
jgi:hypothetical protein